MRTISAKRVETLSLLRNLGQIPPPKSFHLTLSPQTMLFSYRQLFLFQLPTLKGECWERGGSASKKCNVKVIFSLLLSSQFSVSTTFVAYWSLGNEPGPHLWEASPLNTATSLLPKSPKNITLLTSTLLPALHTQQLHSDKINFILNNNVSASAFTAVTYDTVASNRCVFE